MTAKLVTTSQDLKNELKDFKGKLGYIVINSINFHPGYYYLLLKAKQLCDKLLTVVLPVYYPPEPIPSVDEINNVILSKLDEIPCDIVFPFLDYIDREINIVMGKPENDFSDNTNFKDDNTRKKFVTTCIFNRGFSRLFILEAMYTLIGEIKNDDIELIRLRGFSRIFQDFKFFKIFNQINNIKETEIIQNSIRKTTSLYFSELRDKNGFLFRRFDTDGLPISEKIEIIHPCKHNIVPSNFSDIEEFENVMNHYIFPDHSYIFLKLDSSEDIVAEKATYQDLLNNNLVVGIINDTLTKYPRESPTYIDVSGDFYLPSMTNTDYYELYPNRGMVKGTLNNELDLLISNSKDQKFSTIIEIMKNYK